MIKVAIPERSCLSQLLISKDQEFKVITNQEEADFIICQSTVRRTDLIEKVIYIAAEPPLSSHRLWCYNNFDLFKLVVSHNPNHEKINQIPFTLNKEDHAFPSWADAYGMITREDTKIGKRGVFFAGNIGFFENQPDLFGLNITPLRKLLGNFFKNNFPGSEIIGKGWDGQKTKVDDWRRDKLNRIKNPNIDFVLALENTIYPGYISEKIWDGIMSDKVTLYLGAPNIEEFIPDNCFVDLRKWFNSTDKSFDLIGLEKYLKEMTQEEYDEIISNARAFRPSVVGKLRELSVDLTKRIMDYMKNE